MKKIIINKKYYGNIELAKTRNAYNIFVSVIRAFKLKSLLQLRLSTQKRS